MTETLDLPAIDASALAQPSGVPAISVKTDLAKLDLTAVALAQYGDWRKDVAATKANLSTLALDLSTPTKIKEARTLRARLIGEPLAAVRKVAAGIKSKMAATSKALGAELELIEAAYKDADALILPQIEAREAEMEAEREEARKAEEARKEKHRTNLEAIRIYIDRASAPGMTAERIARGIAQLEALPTPTTEQWEEFAVPAANALCETLAKMRELHAKAVAEEAEAIRREQERQEQQRRAAELAEQERRLAAERAEIERQRAELEAARKVAEAQAARVVQVAAPAGYIEPQTVLTTTAKPITQDAQERGSLPAAAGACASAEAKAATAAVSGCEGKGAHAEERAPEPVFNIVSLERGAAAIDAASSGSPELGAVLESIATMELYKITMIEPIRMGSDPRDALLREALALTKYAAAPFFSKFPTHPKTTPEWWAGLREQIEALQPKLIEHIEGLN